MTPKEKFLFLGKLMPICPMELFDNVVAERNKIADTLPFAEWLTLHREERPCSPWARTGVKHQIPKAISA